VLLHLSFFDPPFPEARALSGRFFFFPCLLARTCSTLLLLRVLDLTFEPVLFFLRDVRFLAAGVPPLIADEIFVSALWAEIGFFFIFSFFFLAGKVSFAGSCSSVASSTRGV